MYKRQRLDKEHLSDLKIYLTPHANMLNEIVVYAHNPRLIVEEAIRKDVYKRQIRLPST